MYLARRVVYSGIELHAVVEYALKLKPREPAVWESDPADELSGHGMDCDHTVSTAALEAADIVDVISGAVHALVEKGSLLAFEPDILFRLQIAVEYYDIVVTAEPSDVAVLLRIVCDGGEARVIASHGCREVLYLSRQLYVLVRDDFKSLRVDEHGALLLYPAAGREQKVLSGVIGQTVCVIYLERRGHLDDLKSVEADLDYFALLDLPVVQREIGNAVMGAGALECVIFIELLTCGLPEVEDFSAVHYLCHGSVTLLS